MGSEQGWVTVGENMAGCRDDASVSLLSNMRVMSLLCQGDDTMLQVQRICNNVPGAESIWYNVPGTMYPAKYTWHNTLSTLLHAIGAQYARHATHCTRVKVHAITGRTLL